MPNEARPPKTTYVSFHLYKVAKENPQRQSSNLWVWDGEVWWFTAVIIALGREKKEDKEFKVIVSYGWSSWPTSNR